MEGGVDDSMTSNQPINYGGFFLQVGVSMVPFLEIKVERSILQKDNIVITFLLSTCRSLIHALLHAVLPLCCSPTESGVLRPSP